MRKKILTLLYLGMTKISWAEDVDYNVLQECLNPTFSKWIDIFTQLLDTPAEKFLGLKIQVFKVFLSI